MSPPFHAAEEALQARAGMRERLELVGQRMIRDHMPEDHRELFGKLPFVVVGSLDGQGRPWASILAGRPGFMTSPDARTLRIGASAIPGDPLAANLKPGAPLGLLGIEPHTRRRNRMNGHVTALDPSGFTVEVDQSFGNCPKYIQAREPTPAASAPRTPPTPEGADLSDRAAALIGRADALFIATSAPGRGGQGAPDEADVSHRGGRPGFARLERTSDGAVLTIPDYAGNFHFATLGNILLNPRAGLLFIDFERGDLLMLTGEAELVLEGPEISGFEGAQRLVKFRPRAGLWFDHALPFRWSAPEPSPWLP